MSDQALEKRPGVRLIVAEDEPERELEVLERGIDYALARVRVEIGRTDIAADGKVHDRRIACADLDRVETLFGKLANRIDQIV